MTVKKNSKGFTVIEIMFFVLVAVLIVGAVFFVGKRMGENNDKKEPATSQTEISKPSADDAMKDWKTFTDKRDIITFKYPADWNVDISKVTDDMYPSDGNGDFLEGTITSPSGSVKIGYANFVDGLGGVGCPEAIPCPTVNVLKLDAIPGLINAFKYIEQITDYGGSGGNFQVTFGIMNISDYPKIKTGTMIDNAYLPLTGFGEFGGYFVAGALGGASDRLSFNSNDDAKAFLESADAKTAEQIMKSVRKL